MDFGAALGKPFSNIKNLIIGMILSMIPIVNILAIPGYILRVANRTMNKDNALPGFENFGELVVNSIKFIVVALVYYIILLIVMVILVLIPYIGGVLALIAMIAFVFIMAAAIMELAKTGSIGSALGIPSVAKKAMNGNFIIAVIVGAVVVGIIWTVLMAILGIVFGAAMLPVIAAAQGGVVDPAAVSGMIMGLIGGAVVALVVMIVIGYVLNIFYISLVAEAYTQEAAAAAPAKAAQ